MPFGRLAILVLIGSGLMAAQLFQSEGPGQSPGPVQVYEGVPTIRDGDNVNIDGVNIRLDNIDACELGQIARQANHDFDCGIWARNQFRALIGPRSVRCESSEIDIYDRPLATCYVGEREINRTLVDHGYVFLEDGSTVYREARSEAQAGRRGIWLFETVEHPSDYRRAQRQ